MLIEQNGPGGGARRLLELHDIENRIALHIDGRAPVVAIADEDMDRSTGQKTSAVHFLRFDLDAAQVSAFKQGASVELRVDHPRYVERSVLTEASRAALAADFD